jgi:hypothetical protein
MIDILQQAEMLCSRYGGSAAVSRQKVYSTPSKKEAFCRDQNSKTVKRMKKNTPIPT